MNPVNHTHCQATHSNTKPKLVNKCVSVQHMKKAMASERPIPPSRPTPPPRPTPTPGRPDPGTRNIPTPRKPPPAPPKK